MTDGEILELADSLYGEAVPGKELLRCGTPKTHRAGRVLACQGDEAAEAHLVLAGRFFCRKYRTDDSLIPLPALERGAWCGAAECADGGAYLYEAIAAEESVTLCFARPNFALLRRRCPLFDSIALIPSLSQELRRLHSRLADSSPLDRLVSYLLAQRRSIGGVEKQRVSITQAELGAAIGCTRETANKYLGLLAGRGLIELERSSVVVPSWEKLADYQ